MELFCAAAWIAHYASTHTERCTPFTVIPHNGTCQLAIITMELNRWFSSADAHNHTQGHVNCTTMARKNKVLTGLYNKLSIFIVIMKYLWLWYCLLLSSTVWLRQCNKHFWSKRLMINPIRLDLSRIRNIFRMLSRIHLSICTIATRKWITQRWDHSVWMHSVLWMLRACVCEFVYRRRLHGQTVAIKLTNPNKSIESQTSVQLRLLSIHTPYVCVCVCLCVRWLVWACGCYVFLCLMLFLIRFFISLPGDIAGLAHCISTNTLTSIQPCSCARSR